MTDDNRNEVCVQCEKLMKDRGGPAHFTVELDLGDEYTGGGSSARVRICASCAQARVSDVLALTQRQFAENARQR